jgi:para-aminobenzoate synthetase/4-amino-4-deoxychorismate lyase
VEVSAVIATDQVDADVAVAAAIWRVRLPWDCDVSQVLSALADEPYRCCLVGSWAGGGAIVASDPLRVAEPDQDPFELLTQLPEVADVAAVEGIVGGGWFGWLGYRLAQRVEDVPLALHRPVALPDFHLAYYDNVLRQDRAGVWWFEALATPERYGELEERLEDLRARVARAEALRVSSSDEAPHVLGNSSPKRAEPRPLRLTPEAAAHHLAAVAACRERIAGGEIFQANICLRLESEYDGDAIDLLQVALRAPRLPQFTAAFDTPQGGVVSLSPELFLRREGPHGRHVRTGPIKGTVARSNDPREAAAALEKLRASEKDAAEHVMIVDLMRNDIGRVCEYGSVTAPRRPVPEAHPGLWNLVTHVDGRLRPDVTDRELLRATFPPGSVTGAPKVQSMIVISELESTGREVYTGAVGYVSPLAGLELNVAIRTLELSGRKLWLGVGGGVVADSDPRAELEETLVKARPVAAAIGTTVEGACC